MALILTYNALYPFPFLFIIRLDSSNYVLRPLGDLQPLPRLFVSRLLFYIFKKSPKCLFVWIRSYNFDRNEDLPLSKSARAIFLNYKIN